MKKLLVLSGGLDSMVMAYQENADSGNTVRAVYYDFGRPSRDKELTSVKYTCHALNIPLEIVNAREIQDSSAGLIKNVRFESGDSPDPDPIDIHLSTDRPTGFPIVVEMAAYYATLMNFDQVEFGLLKGQFFGGAGDYLKLSDAARDKINPNVQKLPTSVAPFCDMEKSQVVEIGKKLNVPMHVSWSCFSDDESHCGSCEGCSDRREAFERAAIEDETIYQS